MKTFSAIADVFAYSEQLKKGQLRLLEGIIKPSDKPDVILLELTGCEIWIPIIASAITEIRYLGERPSGRGEKSDLYPYVQLTIRVDGLQEAIHLGVIEQLTKELRDVRQKKRTHALQYPRQSKSILRRADGYITAYIYNLSDVSTNYSIFQVLDNLTGQVQTSPPVYGGQTWGFQCWSEDPSGGDVNITNLTNNDYPVHEQNVDAGDTFSM